MSFIVATILLIKKVPQFLEGLKTKVIQININLISTF